MEKPTDGPPPTALPPPAPPPQPVPVLPALEYATPTTPTLRDHLSAVGRAFLSLAAGGMGLLFGWMAVAAFAQLLGRFREPVLSAGSVGLWLLTFVMLVLYAGAMFVTAVSYLRSAGRAAVAPDDTRVTDAGGADGPSDGKTTARRGPVERRGHGVSPQDAIPSPPSGAGLVPRPADAAQHLLDYADSSLPTPKTQWAGGPPGWLAGVAVCGSLATCTGWLGLSYWATLYDRLTGPPQDPVVSAFDFLAALVLCVGAFLFAAELWHCLVPGRTPDLPSRPRPIEHGNARTPLPR